MKVSLDSDTMNKLEKKCAQLEMNEAVYGRRAIEICLKRNLIDGR